MKSYDFQYDFTGGDAVSTTPYTAVSAVQNGIWNTEYYQQRPECRRTNSRTIKSNEMHHDILFSKMTHGFECQVIRKTFPSSIKACAHSGLQVFTMSLSGKYPKYTCSRCLTIEWCASTLSVMLVGHEARNTYSKQDVSKRFFRYGFSELESCASETITLKKLQSKLNLIFDENRNFLRPWKSF